MTAGDHHAWVKYLTTSHGVQALRHHISTNHTHVHSDPACPVAINLINLLTLYPFHVQALLRLQSDDLMACVAKRLALGDNSMTLEMLLELQTCQFGTLLSHAIRGASSSIRQAFINAQAGSTSSLGPELFSLLTPVEFRVDLCRHLFCLQRPAFEIRPIIATLLMHSSDVDDLQALIHDLLGRFGSDPDLVYSFTAGDSSCFSNHFLKPLAESAVALPARLFELILLDPLLQPLLLDFNAISKLKFTSFFVSNLSKALKAVWFDSSFNTSADQYRLLLGLRDKRLIGEDVLVTIFQSKSPPALARSDAFRFCILSGLSRHQELFGGMLRDATADNCAAIGKTLSDIIMYRQIFSAVILEDALCVLNQFQMHHKLSECLVGSAQFITCCCRDRGALRFLRTLIEQQRISINAELALDTIATIFKLIGDEYPHLSELGDFGALISSGLSFPQHSLDRLFWIVLDLEPINPDVCDILADLLLALFRDSNQNASLYKLISYHDTRNRPLVLRLLLRLLTGSRLPPLDIPTIRMWISPPISPSHELAVVRVVSQCLSIDELMLDVIPTVIMNGLASPDDIVRSNCMEILARLPLNAPVFGFIRWRIDELGQSKLIGCCTPEQAKVLLLLKAAISKMPQISAV